jgi:uncharacterized protein GlcG (DUF336 family)
MTGSNTLSRLALAGITAAATLAAASASAQENLNRFVITGPAAQEALTTNEISLATARQIGEACLAFAAERKRTLAVIIIAPNGQTVWSSRMDGVGPVAIDTALMKAKTALYMRDQTAAWQERVMNSLQTEVRWLPLGQYWTAGGLPIIVDNVMIGAIGVGGAGDIDPDCAHAAMVKVLGPNIPKLVPRPPRTQPFPLPLDPQSAPQGAPRGPAPATPQQPAPAR